MDEIAGWTLPERLGLVRGARLSRRPGNVRVTRQPLTLTSDGKFPLPMEVWMKFTIHPAMLPPPLEPPPPPAGLANVGNTCWMNAAVQVARAVLLLLREQPASDDPALDAVLAAPGPVGATGMVALRTELKLPADLQPHAPGLAWDEIRDRVPLLRHATEFPVHVRFAEEKEPSLRKGDEPGDCTDLQVGRVVEEKDWSVTLTGKGTLDQRLANGLGADAALCYAAMVDDDPERRRRTRRERVSQLEKALVLHCRASAPLLADKAAELQLPDVPEWWRGRRLVGLTIHGGPHGQAGHWAAVVRLGEKWFICDDGRVEEAESLEKLREDSRNRTHRVRDLFYF